MAKWLQLSTPSEMHRLSRHDAFSAPSRLEAWFPVVFGSDDARSKQTALYLAPTSDEAAVVQILVGMILVALSIMIVSRIGSTMLAISRGPAIGTPHASA